MEFILRFFALSSETYRNDKRESISLKRFLDLFMNNNANPSENQLSDFRDRFTSTINFICDVFGASAFHNISPSDPRKLVQKFSPTLFDSISIAADFAISLGIKTPPINHEIKRRSMLQDKEYRLAISKETMTRSSINTRISKACQYLFELDYE